MAKMMGRNVTGAFVLANVDDQGADEDIRPLPPGQEPSISAGLCFLVPLVMSPKVV